VANRAETRSSKILHNVDDRTEVRDSRRLWTLITEINLQNTAVLYRIFGTGSG